MIEFRLALQDYLKTLHPRVKHQEALVDYELPYIVYEIGTALPDGEGFENIPIDIDGWDNPSDGDTTTLENLMTTINNGLDKKTIVLDGMVVTFYLENKLTIRDEDKRIKRRKYVYQARVFEGS